MVPILHMGKTESGVFLFVCLMMASEKSTARSQQQLKISLLKSLPRSPLAPKRRACPTGLTQASLKFLSHPVSIPTFPLG